MRSVRFVDAIRPAALLVALTLTAACASSASGEGDESPAASGGPLKIGILASLSGNLAEDGTAYVDAARAAIEAMENDVGRDVEISVYDERSETTEAVSGTRRLVDSARVDILLSGLTSGNFLATRQVVDRADIPVLTTATAPEVLEDNPGSIFRISQPLPDRIEDNVRFVVDELDARSVAFLQVNDEVQRVFADGAKELLDEDGVDVVSEQYFQYTDNDFSPYLSRLAQADADVTFLGGEVTQCATILEQARAAGVETVFVLPTAASSSDFLESFGDVAEGTYVQTIYAPGTVASAEGRRFEDLAREHGFPLSYFSVVGYSEATIAMEAVARAGSDGDVVEELAGGTFDTPLGRVEFDDDGQAVVDGIVARIDGGRYVEVSE
ncbi:MAG TPA: ABC transporter substrate-binding protein [Actinomycetota bacterium]|nr:ABC transporter substrate-binding protein [Actinomycetota bacterium]